MVKNTQPERLPEQRLTASQLVSFRKQAQKILTSGYNLFADMSLRLIVSHETVAAENDALRRIYADRQLELEFLARENQELRDSLADVEVERRRLNEHIKQQKREIAELKKNKLQMPPSWQ